MSQNLQDGPQPAGPRPDVAPPLPASTSQARPASRPGQAYSPPPSSPSPQPAASASKAQWRLVGLGALAVAGILVGAWHGFSGGNAPAPTPVAAVDQQEKTLAVAAVDADVKATEHLKAILSGGASTTEAANDELRAMNAAGLESLAKTSLKMAADIQSGRRVLYRVYLLDFLVEDGDHVEFSVDGASFGDTVLQGAGTSFLIPLAPGTPAHLKLLATADGGGGVTVGFISSLGEARTRVMQVGDFDQWQVVVQ